MIPISFQFNSRGSRTCSLWRGKRRGSQNPAWLALHLHPVRPRQARCRPSLLTRGRLHIRSLQHRSFKGKERNCGLSNTSHPSSLQNKRPKFPSENVLELGATRYSQLVLTLLMNHFPVHQSDPVRLYHSVIGILLTLWQLPASMSDQNMLRKITTEQYISCNAPSKI
jgi:hypothetical protein